MTCQGSVRVTPLQERRSAILRQLLLAGETGNSDAILCESSIFISRSIGRPVHNVLELTEYVLADRLVPDHCFEHGAGDRVAIFEELILDLLFKVRAESGLLCQDQVLRLVACVSATVYQAKHVVSQLLVLLIKYLSPYYLNHSFSQANTKRSLEELRGFLGFQMALVGLFLLA